MLSFNADEAFRGTHAVTEVSLGSGFLLCIFDSFLTLNSDEISVLSRPDLA